MQYVPMEFHIITLHFQITSHTKSCTYVESLYIHNYKSIDTSIGGKQATLTLCHLVAGLQTTH